MNLKKLTSLFLCLTLSLVFLTALPVFAVDTDGDGEEDLLYMAYNFYSGPDLSNTSKKFDSFMIDFRAEKTPHATYWSLANFNMDLSSSKTQRTYRQISGCGAYCGLQNTSGRMGILSFWDMKYKNGKDTVVMTASRVYPKGSSTFGGEGEGTNCIMRYDWKDNQWYRMLLHCWEDKETGTTFAGVWFLDIETGRWTLFSYFDTHLYDSFFIGGMSQFMENFSGGDPTCNCNVERNCNLKNMYVFDHVKKEWISLPTATLSYGDGGPQNEDQRKFGAHSFGATDEYFWGSTGGKVADQEAYERAAIKQKTYTIKQPENPDLGAPALKSLFLSSRNKLSWKFEDASTPQLSYKIKIVDTEGKAVYENEATRPDVRSEVISDLQTSAVKCTLTVTDVFGAQSTITYKTDAYKEATGEVDDAPDAGEPAADPADGGKAKSGLSSGALIALIAAAAIAGVLLVGGGAVAAIVIISKKKQSGAGL